MQQQHDNVFIVGNPGAFYRGRWLNPGAKVRLKEGELPSLTWTWPNGAPVELEVQKAQDGTVRKKLKPAAAPPAQAKPRTDEDEIREAEDRILELEERIEQLREAKRAREKPALSQAQRPPKSPGVEDGNKPPAKTERKPEEKSHRPSDQEPA